MRTRKIHIAIGAILLMLMFSACARLPEYAQPHFIPAEEMSSAGGNSFGYRLLTVDDFRASLLPAGVAGHKHSIRARSCITIRPNSSSTIRMTRGLVQGQLYYAAFFDKIRFEAVFNPDCSWWNPDLREAEKAYVLQHEQIHFALTELTARRINREQSGNLEKYQAIGRTVKEAYRQLLSKAKEISHEVMEVDIQEHASFDEETSMDFAPRAQQEWYDRVTAHLDEGT